MPDVGSKSGAMSKLIGIADNLRNGIRAPRFPTGLFTMFTKNTTRTCSTCYGWDHSFRSIGIEHSDGSLKMHHCPNCKGTGVIKI